MLPPSTLRVGPHTYQVVLVPNGVMIDAERRGHTMATRLVIAIEPDMPASMVADTLIHEAVHAILRSIVLEDTVEEQVALLMGPAVLALLRDNPELLTYLESVT